MNYLTKIQLCHISVILMSLICVHFIKINCAQNTNDCSNVYSYLLPTCPPGYTLTNGVCFLESHVPAASCPTGYQLYNNSFCYPISALPCLPYIAPVTTTRPSQTVENQTESRCPPGSVYLQNECRKLVCSQGEYHKGRCLQAACANGKVWRGRRCQDPEYVTTIIEIENVFTDSKPEKSDNLDVQILERPAETEEFQNRTYFSKTIIRPEELNLDIETTTNTLADSFLASDNNVNILDVLFNTNPPFSNMNSTEQNNTNIIYLNKTVLGRETRSNNTRLTDNLNVQVIVSEPHTKLPLLDVNKTIVDDAVNQANFSHILNNAEIAKSVPTTTTEISTTTTTTTTLKTIDSTVVVTTPSMDNISDVCCKVHTPRICKKHGARWLCFNRSYKICDNRVCTHDMIHLRSPEIAYKAPLLIMPPDPQLSDCVSKDCENQKPRNCDGCITYQAETCSSYCYRYLCEGDSCGFMDHQLFCNYYAGEFGCQERDGCIWNWCEPS